MEKKGFFEGGFGKYILPGVIVQSVMVGGGYATGREIIEYGAKFGALGWIAGLGIFLGFAIVAVLSFELIRLYKVYDYKSFIKEIAGPFWILFDIVYVVLLIIIIAVMASATGSIVEQTLGMNYYVGVVTVIVIVGILNFYGERLIERFETLGTVALYAGYILFAFLVISGNMDNIKEVFATTDTSYTPGATAPLALWTGIMYVGYNLVCFPASFFTIKRQTSRKQSVIAGIIAGFLTTVPWFLTYFAVMGFYPSEDVLGASVPWLVMMASSDAGVLVIAFFGIVMGWTLIETSTGVIHALIERINGALEDSNKNHLTRPQQAIVTIIILVGAMFLSSVGIIDLISKGYNACAYGFLLIYLLPLITVGVYKICKKRKEEVSGS